jgi:hypothetical protein
MPRLVDYNDTLTWTRAVKRPRWKSDAELKQRADQLYQQGMRYVDRTEYQQVTRQKSRKCRGRGVAIWRDC